MKWISSLIHFSWLFSFQISGLCTYGFSFIFKHLLGTQCVCLVAFRGGGGGGVGGEMGQG